jgi:iron uptake system component EfeO
MINGSAGLIEEAATGKITGDEERYAGTSLQTFAANVEGAREIIDLNADLLKDVDPDLYATIEKSFDDIEAGLAKYSNGDGTYKDYSTLTDADRAPLKAELAVLSENLSQVAAAFGLEVS